MYLIVLGRPVGVPPKRVIDLSWWCRPGRSSVPGLKPTWWPQALPKDQPFGAFAKLCSYKRPG